MIPARHTNARIARPLSMTHELISFDQKRQAYSFSSLLEGGGCITQIFQYLTEMKPPPA